MDFTYLDYFNYYLKEFCNELINNFPETQVPLLSNYRPLLEGRDDKNDFYSKCFYTKINNYLANIAKREVELFQTPGKVFIEGVDLYVIWNSSGCTDNHRVAIWKYLQILMILGRRIIPNHQEIVQMLQKVSNGEVNIPAKVEKTLTTEEKDESDEAPGVFGLGDIASSLGSLGSLANGLGLGNLAAGLGGGANGEGGAGLGNLVSGITQMFSNPDFTNAMSQLSQTMSQSMQQQSDTSVTEGVIDSEGADGEECASATEAGTTCPPMNDNGEAGATGSSATGSGTSASAGLFGNPLFGELAKELTETFDFKEMEAQGKPANIGEALGKFMSGDNPAKLMGLVGKFGSKLQQEVQRGGINPADLLQQTMGALGGAGGANGGMAGMANMMQQMAQNPQVRQAARQQATRDRLRAKLDSKKAQQK
jgi:hypothetical protein